MSILIYSLLAGLVLILTASVGSFFQMSVKMISLVQHFTAGIVFAAVATEILPKILEAHSPLHVIIGFVLGVGLMVLIKTLSNNIETSDGFPWGLLVGVGIDLFIDGLLLAIAFLSGEKTGQIMAFALSMEVAFLALALATKLQKKVNLQSKMVIFLTLSLLLPIGTIVGNFILNYLPQTFFTEALSFGAAALLFLVIEELLVEAHETKDTPLITSSFFLGFLMIFLV